jgi:hypothetical protein
MPRVMPESRFFQVELERGMRLVKAADLPSLSEEDSTVMLNVPEHVRMLAQW